MKRMLLMFSMFSLTTAIFGGVAVAQAPEVTIFTITGPNQGHPSERGNAVGRLPDPGCPTMFIFFDSELLTSGPTHEGGNDFSGGIFDIPSDAKPGNHTVKVACSATGGEPSVSTKFTVLEGKPAPVRPLPRTGGDQEVPFGGARSEVVEHTPRPGDVDWSPKRIGRNLLLAIIAMLLIVFPSQLFNSTLEENYAEIRGWFGFKGEGKIRKSAATWSKAGIFLTIGALLYGFLDPGVGFNKASLALVIGLFAALAVTSLVFGFSSVAYMKRKHGDHGTLRALPGTLIVALACVIVSRLAHFEPGYFYGLLIGFAFTSELGANDEAKAVGVSFVWMFGVAIVSWLLWSPVTKAASGSSSVFLMIPDAVLAAIFVAGLETMAFGLIPIRYMAGEKVFRGNKFLWAGLFTLGMLGLFHILLDPAAGYVAFGENTSLKTVFILFIGFGLTSIAFWGFFRFRPNTGRGSQADVDR